VIRNDQPYKSLLIRVLSPMCTVLALTACNAPQEGVLLASLFNAELTHLELAPEKSALGFPEDYTLNDIDGKAIVLESCDALTVVDPDKLAGLYFQYYQSARNDCVSAIAYRAGNDARVSHLRSIDLASVVSKFPSNLRPYAGAEERERDKNKNRSLTLSEVQTDMIFEADTPDSLIASFDGYSVDYNRVAMRDLNGDGIEDMILYVNSSIIGGSWRNAEVFFLTRIEPNGPIDTLPFESFAALKAFR